MKICLDIFKSLFIGIFLVSLASSCVADKYDEPEAESNERMIVLRVSTVTPFYGTETSANVREKIQSLRLVILSDGYIEFNQYVQIPQGNDDADEFTYLFKAPYINGNKRFFFIANEESVNKTSLTFDNALDNDIKSQVTGKTLSEILNLETFRATGIPMQNDDGNGSGTDNQDDSGYVLEKVLTAISFNPSATFDIVDESSQSTASAPQGSIYIPYSVYYSQNDLNVITNDEGEVTGIDDVMYLVPVATKFEFHFINNRSHNVEISGISLTQADSHNYLYAKVGSQDNYRDLPLTDGTTLSLYWPDWLAKVAENSWGFTGSDANLDFNKLNGWITDYSIPASSQQYVNYFLPSQSVETVPAGVTNSDETITPGLLNLGPFYLPESFYYNELSETSQLYYLSMNIHDVSNSSQDPDFNDISIENLGALFRNTHMVITIVMGEGDAGVYAELKDWNYKESWGYMGDYSK